MIEHIGWIITFVGLIGAWLYGRKTTMFRWREYFAILAGPFVGLLLQANTYGIRIIYFFLASCIFGWFAELIFAFLYEKVLGEKFWVYRKGMLFSGYVSIMTLPVWGFAGILFFKIAKFFFIIS